MNEVTKLKQTLTDLINSEKRLTKKGLEKLGIVLDEDMPAPHTVDDCRISYRIRTAVTFSHDILPVNKDKSEYKVTFSREIGIKNILKEALNQVKQLEGRLKSVSLNQIKQV